MANELQNTLNEILEDKNTNLKPENLKQGVTCLGVEGTMNEGIDTSDATATARDIAMNKIAYISRGKVTGTGFLGKNIYGALDYTSKTYTVQKISSTGNTSSPYYPETYIFGKLTLRYSYDTNIYIYYDGEFIGEYTCKFTGRKQKYLGVVYYDDEQYIFIVNNEQIYTTNYEAISVNYITKTITDLGQISTIDETSSFKTTGKECCLGSSNYLYRYQKDTNTFKKYNKFPSSVMFFTGNNFAIFKGSTSGSGDGYVSKFIYDGLSDTYTITSTRRNDVDGVNFYGNKIFIKGNVYTLNADLSVGELLAENVYTVNQSNSVYFLWINEKYAIYNSVLYYWDDTNNTFTKYIPMYYATLGGYSVLNYVDITQYTFTNSEEIIGVNINGRDFYFNQGQIDGTSDEVLFGKTVYTSGADVMLGTMPNNGDVTIEPTIEQQTKSSGYYNSLQVNPVTSSIDANIKAENIKKDISILGVTGTLEGGTDTSDATATVKDILAGKTAYVDGEKLEGTMANNGDLIITPNTDEQDHSAGYYNSIQVRPVTSSVDTNIKAENIKSGISILGVSGSLVELNGHELEVTPATVQKVIEPEENYNAITRVTVEAVTSSIDSNIKPENIKKDVSILGVTGSLEASGGSDVTPVYQTTEYTVKDISVDLNEEVDSVSTYEDYVVVHTTLNKLKVYNKSNLTQPLMSLGDVSLPNQQFMYVFDKVDNKLYISFGDDGTAEQGYWIADLTSNNITKGTYTNKLGGTQNIDVHIDRLNHLVHYRNGRNNTWFYMYSYDAIQGFTQLVREYSHFGPYLGNNVYEGNKNIIIINNNGSYSDHEVVPSNLNYAVCGLNYLRTKVFVYSSDNNICYVYSLNDDYSLNELLNTIELSFGFTDGRPMFECLNSNYYYLSYNGNNYILKFDEDINQFSIVVTNERLYVRNSLPIIQYNNQYIDFQQGDTEIGILYNGNQYLTRDKYTGYTNSALLTGNTMYDIAHQIVAGTMPNNGDVTIAPTTSEQVKEQGYYNSLKVSAVTSAIDSNIIPENIKSGVSVLGVEGTLEEGIDTSDANATASDIAIDKTAYVNGEKITGTLPLFPNTRTFTVSNAGVTNNTEDSTLDLTTINTTKQILDSNVSMNFNADYSDVATAIGLTADKIKVGETILGVTGTYNGEVLLGNQVPTSTPDKLTYAVVVDDTGSYLGTYKYDPSSESGGTWEKLVETV